jgi:type II secretory pathway pseudopilin PulG
MRRTTFPLGTSDGWTLVELVLTVSILLILMGILAASYETFKARIRSSQARADMDSIAMAGTIDYTNSNTNMWATLTYGEMPPEFASANNLSKWPQAPCPGWYYSWENWADFDGYEKVAVTLRNANNFVVWNYCVNTFGGAADCQYDPLKSMPGSVDLSVNPIKHLYCNE